MARNSCFESSHPFGSSADQDRRVDQSVGVTLLLKGKHGANFDLQLIIHIFTCSWCKVAFKSNEGVWGRPIRR
jgi:hypothetical protein